MGEQTQQCAIAFDSHWNTNLITLTTMMHYTVYQVEDETGMLTEPWADFPSQEEADAYILEKVTTHPTITFAVATTEM